MISRTKKHFFLYEVFTPSQPAYYTYVPRLSIDKRLERAFNTPGKQIIVYGFSGSGKSTILMNKLKSGNIKFISTQCMMGTTISDILIEAFDKLDVYYNPNIEKSTKKKVQGSLQASYLAFKASLSGERENSSKVNSKKAVDLPITPQTLAKYMGEAGFCWIIEDFHKMDASEKKKMSQIMKVFMDSSIEYPKLKIIAIGAVNTAREVVQLDPEMRNRVAEIEVPLMKIDFLKEILIKGQKLLNIHIPDAVIDKITVYSAGLPSVTHDLAYFLCDLNNIQSTHKSIKRFEIPSKSFDEALDEYAKDKSDTFRADYELATRVIKKKKIREPCRYSKCYFIR